MKAKFDGYAEIYDQWFMDNENMYLTELDLVYKSLKDLNARKSLSVGCGSGLFEVSLKDKGIIITDGLEPSIDMAEIAKKRGLDVRIGVIEEANLEDNYYDLIYLNGSSTYIKDLEKSYKNVYDALKKGGHIVIIDVPKESAFGILYQFAKYTKTYDLENFEGILPISPYPIPLVESSHMRTTLEKRDILEEIGFKNFNFYQTLITSPAYSNEIIEEACEGYDRGSYVSIIAEK